MFSGSFLMPLLAAHMGNNKIKPPGNKCQTQVKLEASEKRRRQGLDDEL